MNNFSVLIITKGNIVVANVALQMLYIHRIRRVFDVWLSLHDFNIAAETGDAFGVTLNYGIDLLNRPEKDVGQE